MIRYLMLVVVGVTLLAAPKGVRFFLPETKDAPQSCGNLRDDDGDFVVDCEERDCWAHPTCQPPTCSPDQCQRVECRYSPPCFEADCDDQQDNDQDGASDCFDPDCDSFVGCAIELCQDSADNDQNGASDCDDPVCEDRDGCVFHACVDACLGQESCDDKKDNDQDGLFDCRDPDCYATEACGGKRELGAGCSQSVQCASGACMSELTAGYPDGLCTRECSDNADCGGSLCVAGLCLSGCQSSDDCRDGYSCLHTTNGDACLPDCGDADDCPDTGACNVYSGYCAAESGAKRDQAICSADDECESSHCLDGFCVSFCSGDHDNCPPQFDCQVEAGATSDAGICVPSFFAINYVAPWEQPYLLPQLYEEQRLSTHLVAPSPISDAASPLFSLDKVHVIEINLSTKEREALSLDNKEWARASFSFDGEPLDEIGVRLKGGDGSGRELPKKAALSLKFDAFVRDLSLYGEKKLLLNNAVQDPSYLSEAMAYWLYQRYGIPAPRVSYAEVFINKESYGLYVVVEAKDKRFLQSRLGSSRPLYEGTYGADFDRVDGLEEHIEGGLPTLLALQDFFRQTEDRQLLPQLGSYLDIDQFFQVWSIDAFFDHWDGYFFQVNNFYLYQGEDGRFRLLPHGADQLFGTRDTRVDATPTGTIAKHLARSSLVKERFLQGIERLMSDSLLESDFRAKVDSLASLIDAAASRDTKREFTEEQREIFTLWIREYIRARRDFIEVSGALLYGAPYQP